MCGREVQLLTLPSGADVGSVCLAASRGLQRLTAVLLMMNGLASPRGISANPVRVQMIHSLFFFVLWRMKHFILCFVN